MPIYIPSDRVSIISGTYRGCMGHLMKDTEKMFCIQLDGIGNNKRTLQSSIHHLPSDGVGDAKDTLLRPATLGSSCWKGRQVQDLNAMLKLQLGDVRAVMEQVRSKLDDLRSVMEQIRSNVKLILHTL
jgi:hypothetical protein